MRLVRIVGDSMLPRYRSGDYVVVGRYQLRQPRCGDDVVFEHADHGLLLKRIARVQGSSLTVRGLNGLSTQSGEIGPIRIADMDKLARVVWRIPSPRDEQP